MTAEYAQQVDLTVKTVLERCSGMGDAALMFF